MKPIALDRSAGFVAPSASRGFPRCESTSQIRKEAGHRVEHAHEAELQCRKEGGLHPIDSSGQKMQTNRGGDACVYHSVVCSRDELSSTADGLGAIVTSSFDLQYGDAPMIFFALSPISTRARRD